MIHGYNYIPLIIEKLKEENIIKVILFGSYATEHASEDSDIDLLVVTGDEFYPSNYNEKKNLYYRISNRLSDIKQKIPIDLIVYTRPMYEKFLALDSMFSRDIHKNGKVIIDYSVTE